MPRMWKPNLAAPKAKASSVASTKTIRALAEPSFNSRGNRNWSPSGLDWSRMVERRCPPWSWFSMKSPTRSCLL